MKMTKRQADTKKYRKAINEIGMAKSAEIGGFTVFKTRDADGFAKVTLEAAGFYSGDMDMDEAAEWIADAQ
jgi:hypothetical protein